jgi:sulfhydrogenase subunit beta (sulfur reductase)
MDQSARVLSLDGLEGLLALLRADGYRLIGPRVRDGAIVYGDLDGLGDLPVGWGEEQEAGRYRLVQRGDGRLFGFSTGPQSLKREFFVPRARLVRLRRTGDGFAPDPNEPAAPPLAVIGARACDLAAVAVQDRTFLGGPFR